MPPRREPVNNPLAARLSGAMAAAMDEMLNDEPTEKVVEVPVEVQVEIPALAVTNDGTIPAKGFQITRTGLMRYPDASQEDWLQVGQALTMLQDSIQWLIGDWLLFGETVYGISAKEAAERIGREIGTIYNWASISGKIEFSRRREKLSFSHHIEVAALPPEQQSYWLERAELENWSIRRLRIEIRKANGLLLTPAGISVKDDLRWLMRHAKHGVGERKKSESLNRIARMRTWLDELERSLSES